MTHISEITDGIALECLKQIASEGRVACRDELMGAIGTRNMCGSTATGVINRLIRNGKVEHVLGYPLQRGLRLRIVETGAETALGASRPSWGTSTG